MARDRTGEATGAAAAVVAGARKWNTGSDGAPVTGGDVGGGGTSAVPGAGAGGTAVVGGDATGSPTAAAAESRPRQPGPQGTGVSVARSRCTAASRLRPSASRRATTPLTWGTAMESPPR